MTGGSPRTTSSPIRFASFPLKLILLTLLSFGSSVCVVLKLHANYINALAASISRFFEPAGRTTLGRKFTTLGNLVFIFFCRFLIYYTVTCCSNNGHANS
jgi:hypothetical protein